MYLHYSRTWGVAMTITTLSSRQFNQDASKAKKAAMAGPVFITDRGRPAHVLLTFDEYKKLTGGHTKIATYWRCPATRTLTLISRNCATSTTGGLLLMYLLDTNVVSELRKIRLGKADAHVANWPTA